MPFIKVAERVNLFVQDWGTGEPIVFIHGWPLSHRIFEYPMRVLAQCYRVIGIDLRGFGQSDKPWEGNDYDTWSNDIAQVIRALDLREVMLVGFCMGGAIAVNCLATHSDLPVTKLALLAATVPAAAPTPETQKLFRGFIEQNLADPAKFVHDFIAGGFQNPPSAESLRWLEERGAAASLHAQERGLEELLNCDLTEEMAQIGIATRIFHGLYDRVVPFTDAETQRRLIRGAEIVRFEKSGHALYWEEKEKLTEELAGFAFEKIAWVA
ncbi:MAG: alpha/beta hydrolase [Candidatus Manganitrophaceae bacterium]|nr:MAG: alpha/beta hydrolase [Candidatus Manganitrophaceae bacterium]